VSAPNNKTWLGAALALAIGCGSSVPDPLPANGGVVGNPGATARTPVAGPQRPDVLESFPLDYAAIPHLVATEMGPAETNAVVSMIKTPSGAEQARVSGDLLAEIEIGGTRAFTSDTIDPSDVKPQGCASRAGTSPVSWEGFSLATWTDHFIDYVRFEGTYDFESCRAKPTRVAKVRAPAIVPGVAYAFRTCVPVCTRGQPSGDEELLVVVGPPAKWVGASVPWPKMQTEPHVGLFSRIIVPLKRGGSASAFLHVSDTDLNGFVARRKLKSGRAPALPKAPLVQLSVDFSWPDGDPLPVGVGFIGTVSNAAPTSGVYDFADEAVQGLAFR
jgi:hypothetical protein